MLLKNKTKSWGSDPESCPWRQKIRQPRAASSMWPVSHCQTREQGLNWDTQGGEDGWELGFRLMPCDGAELAQLGEAEPGL